jgi:hypothetical protein
MKCGYALLLIASFSLSGIPKSLAAVATVHGIVSEGTSSRPAPCTVTLTDAAGRVVLENEAFRGGFRSTGEFTKTLLPGLTHLRVTRGFETKAIDRELNLVAGRTNELRISLDRAVDLRKRGWYSGDNHVHMLHGERTVPVSFGFMALSARAEELQYMSVAQGWNFDEPTPERLEAELRKHSTLDCLLMWNLEAPKNYYKGDAGRCLGHCWNLGVRGRTAEGSDVIRTLMEASAWDYESGKPSYANFESHLLIHKQAGVACYSHPARWWMGSWGGQAGYPRREQMRVSNMAVELPLDTLLGPTYDGLDIITGPGEFEANAKAFELWCLLLNHGYRIAATGSSDSCFDRPGGGVPGSPRTYTFIEGGFSFRKAANAIAAGRTFVTTGPLVVATVDGKPPGSVFTARPRALALSIEAWASGCTTGGLQRVEVLRNGQPWQQFLPASQAERFVTNINIVERDTSWYAVRVLGTARQTAVSGAFYIAQKGFRPAQPATARIHARIMDADNGRPVSVMLTEVSCCGTLVRDGKRHRLSSGEAHLSVPGTVRVRAEAPGYLPLTLSPFLDNPDMVQAVTGLTDEDLLKWETFERLNTQLENVELVFRLQKSGR